MGVKSELQNGWLPAGNGGIDHLDHHDCGVGRKEMKFSIRI